LFDGCRRNILTYVLGCCVLPCTTPYIYELGFSLDHFSKKLLCKMMKERAILIESRVDDQELA